MLYTVKIKRVGGLLWEKFSNIENDWIMHDFLPNYPKRVIVDKDKNSYEINSRKHIVVFSKERPIGELKPSRIKFDVKYKKEGSLFWKTIKNCVINTTMYELTNNPIMVAITDEGIRWEIPHKKHYFKFDKNKLLAIQDIMSQEANQSIDAIK